MRQRENLIKEVSKAEIDTAMKGISTDSAPGPDGFNSLFFNKVWFIVKEDFYQAIKRFFEYGKIYEAMNCTSITLIPKSLQTNTIAQFRPISYCLVFYNIISRVLTRRL